jgi:hypothetical protein
MWGLGAALSNSAEGENLYDFAGMARPGRFRAVFFGENNSAAVQSGVVGRAARSQLPAIAMTAVPSPA